MIDKGQITTIQDGQTGEKVSQDTKANFDLLVDEINKKVMSSDISEVKVVSSMPESPSAKTLYIVTSA